jgi:hypothetical protein
MMTRNIVSKKIPWYVDELDNKVICQICGYSFMKKDVRMLNHLRCANRNGQRDSNIKLCKNMKPEVAPVF